MSIFSLPISDFLKDVCLVRFDSSTMSKSTNMKLPIPRRAKISTVVDPIPPTPTIKTVEFNNLS